MNRSTWQRRGPEVVGVSVIAAVTALAVAVIAGAAVEVAALACGALLLLGAVLGVLGWRVARARAVHAEAVAEHACESQRRDRERLERQLRRLEGERGRQLELIQRLRQSWQAEREWNRELRDQINRLHTSRGLTGDGDDVRALILRAAIQLVDAEKGLLVSREDADSDGALDVVLSEGFENDPDDSALADRFAREVLARDEIVRDDDPQTSGGAKPTPADQEIDALVAVPLYLRDRFYGVIVCVNRPGGFDDVGDELLLALGDHAGAALHHGRLQHELHDAQRSSLRLLAEALAAHDPVLHRETGELALHAGRLAKELGMDDAERDVMTCATLLRAVGYLALPERPRLRPGPLTPDERSLIELHPRVGFNIIVQAPSLRDVATAVLYHHERFDGTGYPAGLAGAEIPVVARALAVLEAFGAMTHERPYRTPWPVEQACEAIVEASGTQFDPEIAQVFIEQIRRAPHAHRVDVGDAVLDALPLDPQHTEDGIPHGLVGTSVDALTLLGNARSLQHDVHAAAAHASSFEVILLELIDLPRINREAGFIAGDRLIQQAARRARHAAARLGGTAYRMSGRRLAIFVPRRESHLLRNPVDEVLAEFIPGPAVRVAMSERTDGEAGEAVLAHAREALRQDHRGA
jgi:GGDEF domain-containing protein